MAAWSRPRETELQAFERSILEFSRAEMEKNAGDFSEAMDSLLETKNSTPRVDRLLEQTATAQQMGRELAIKQAGIAGMVGSAVGALKPMAGKALGWAAKNPGHAMAAGGAALGALGGAATAQPGSRLKGALGGAALGGAAGFGASKLPGGMGQKAMDYTSGVANMGLNRMGMPMKFASAKTAGMLSTGLGRAGAGALVGGAMGALHSSDASRQGLAPAHHLRNAMLGAAGGAALGGALHKMPVGGAAAAEGTLAKTHMPSGGTMHSYGTPSSASAKLRQMPTTPMSAGTPMHADDISRVRGMMESSAKGDPRRLAWIQKNNPHLYPEMNGPATAGGARPPTNAVQAKSAPAAGGPAATVARKKPSGAPQVVNPMANTAMAKLGGAAFLKMAWAEKVAGPPPIPTAALGGAAKILRRPPPIPAAARTGALQSALKGLTPQGMSNLQAVPKFASIQAEPGTPGGAQEPEETDQQLMPAGPPMRESKPAMELYGALKHLSPKTMRGLQVAQPGT
jgi:hypothetical protein